MRQSSDDKALHCGASCLIEECEIKRQVRLMALLLIAQPQPEILSVICIIAPCSDLEVYLTPKKLFSFYSLTLLKSAVAFVGDFCEMDTKGDPGREMALEKQVLYVPKLDEMADVLDFGLKQNYKDVSCSVVDCPDLSKEPFGLAAAGICGKSRLADVGGVPYLVPSSRYMEKVYDLQVFKLKSELCYCTENHHTSLYHIF